MSLLALDMRPEAVCYPYQGGAPLTISDNAAFGRPQIGIGPQSLFEFVTGDVEGLQRGFVEFERGGAHVGGDLLG